MTHLPQPIDRSEEPSTVGLPATSQPASSLPTTPTHGSGDDQPIVCTLTYLLVLEVEPVEVDSDGFPDGMAEGPAGTLRFHDAAGRPLASCYVRDVARSLARLLDLTLPGVESIAPFARGGLVHATTAPDGALGPYSTPWTIAVDQASFHASARAALVAVEEWMSLNLYTSERPDP